MYKKHYKHILDFFFSLICLFITLPLIIFISLTLHVTNKGKVFFIQARPGKEGKIFKIIKFKTMTDAVDLNGVFLPDELRMTKIGRFIRKFSLDELLQLVNVLKGDMSLIGPRPLLVEYLPLYNEFQKKRHLVKPGITGWAQVNGRNAISWKDKFMLDVWYVDNVSFMLDLKIIFLTIVKILKVEGINSQGVATANKFNGNN